MSEKDLAEKLRIDGVEYYKNDRLPADLVERYSGNDKRIYLLGAASRDAEVAKLEARVKELEKWLFESEMTGNFHRCSKCPDIHKEPNDQK